MGGNSSRPPPPVYRVPASSYTQATSSSSVHSTSSLRTPSSFSSSHDPTAFIVRAPASQTSQRSASGVASGSGTTQTLLSPQVATTGVVRTSATRPAGSSSATTVPSSAAGSAGVVRRSAIIGSSAAVPSSNQAGNGVMPSTTAASGSSTTLVQKSTLSSQTSQRSASVVASGSGTTQTLRSPQAATTGVVGTPATRPAGSSSATTVRSSAAGSSGVVRTSAIMGSSAAVPSPNQASNGATRSTTTASGSSTTLVQTSTLSRQTSQRSASVVASGSGTTRTLQSTQAATPGVVRTSATRPAGSSSATTARSSAAGSSGVVRTSAIMGSSAAVPSPNQAGNGVIRSTTAASGSSTTLVQTSILSSTGVVTSSTRNATGVRSRIAPVALPTSGGAASSARATLVIDLGDSCAPFDPHSFDSPAAKKLNSTQVPPPTKPKNPVDDVAEEDFIIALAAKFSRVVAIGGSPVMNMEQLTKALGVDVENVRSLCQKYPGLFQRKERAVKCLAFSLEVSREGPSWGTGGGRGRGRGRRSGGNGLNRTPENKVDDELRICYKYNLGSYRDHSAACRRLHVCCRWLYGKCDKVRCYFPHTIVDSYNNYLMLSQYGLSSWTDEKLKLLFLAFEHQIGTVCERYSSPNGCSDGQGCDHFHMCSEFVDLDKVCVEYPCHLNHKINSCENRQNLLKLYGVKRFDDADQLLSRLRMKLCQVPKVSMIESLELGTNLPRNNGNRSAVPADKVVVWKFLDNDGSWKVQGSSVARVSFGLHVSSILEEAYQANELDQLKLKIGIHSYKFSQIRLEQTNEKTGVARKLRRGLVDAWKSLPPEWIPMAYANVEHGAVLFPLEKTSDEFKGVEGRFNEDDGVAGSTILEIYRVQNPYLKKGFNHKKAELIRVYKSNNGPRIEELLLFHGTKDSVVKHICEQNFDWRRSGEATGNVYGQGAYFALNSAYSHTYTTALSDGTRLMFVASVLVGTKIRGRSSMKYPPDWKDTIQYDTTVDDETVPTIFVKYDKTEYYPAYIVQYHAEGARYPRSD